MPINPDRTFDSSRLLAYKLYVVKYFKLLDRIGTVEGNPKALETFMREIERDFPNDKVHPGDVIIVLADLAWRLAQRQKMSAAQIAEKTVKGWKGTGHRSQARTDDRPGDIARRHGLAMPVSITGGGKIRRPN